MCARKLHDLRRLLIGTLAITVSLHFAGADIASAQTPQQLFFIARTKNANKVYYDARVTKEGILDPKKPVHAYWIMWAKDSSGKTREEISGLERRMAYGVTVSAATPQACTMSITALRDRTIKVYRRGATYVGETTIAGRPSILRKISVVSNDATLVPRVSSVTLYGTDTASGQEIMETIRP